MCLLKVNLLREREVKGGRKEGRERGEGVSGEEGGGKEERRGSYRKERIETVEERGRK